MTKKVLIMGAGPAGLGAASELTKNYVYPILIDKDKQAGGLSKTIEKNGYYFDLGGHRFFTKIPEVTELWQKTLGEDFLIRPRISRIYYRNKFFKYPIELKNVLKNLGFLESAACLGSYISSKFFPYKKEKTFDKWVSNRFGKRLYKHFFKSYTEKLWGIPCNQIQAEFAAQRIKNLSLWGAIKNALPFGEKGKIKSLIDKFHYPKYGPGMMYSTVAKNVEARGAEIKFKNEIQEINYKGNKVKSILIENENGSNIIEADYLLSSIPITELIKKMRPKAPQKVINAAANLTYRSFVTINIIYKKKNTLEDTWLYIHSPEVKLGRVQIFNNWSPYMVKNKNYTSLGLEYFCTEGDAIWNRSENKLAKLADSEVKKIGLMDKKAKIFQTSYGRYAKAYPTYDPGYMKNLKIIKDYLESFKNLQPIGRYGMFRYNNMDHSILTGILAARNIILGKKKYDIWDVNEDQEYHEEKRKNQ
jgi:protoporphyrinogen oxidase